MVATEPIFGILLGPQTWAERPPIPRHDNDEWIQ